VSSRQRIAIDMDETIVDTMGRHLEWYNNEFGQALTKTDLRGTKIYQRVVAEHVAAVRAYPDHPDFFVDIPPYPDAVDVIRELSEQFDIFIATAAMEHPNSFTAKYQWLVKHLSFLSPMNFIFCGNKGLVHAHYLIDDSPRHFTHFQGEGILFTAPHNVLETRYKRVDNWQDVHRLFL
jgi:5'-nucleotidase